MHDSEQEHSGITGCRVTYEWTAPYRLLSLWKFLRTNTLYLKSSHNQPYKSLYNHQFLFLFPLAVTISLSVLWSPQTEQCYCND